MQLDRPDGPPRPTAHETMMQFAELLARRATCRRLHVGAVVTDARLLQVLGIGYNGNAAGLPNTCDSEVVGACGCVHAELNALLKAPGVEAGKQLFTTTAPCFACAKAIINANVTHVWFRLLYRRTEGLVALRCAGVVVTQLNFDGSTIDYTTAMLSALATR